jgi:hypothetical protein
MSIAYEQKVLPPTTYHVQITEHGHDSLTLFVNVSDSGVVFCAAISAAQSLYSSDQVFFLGTAATATVRNSTFHSATNETVYTLVGADRLQSLTSYMVFCGAQSRSDSFTSLQDIGSTKAMAVTACCKSLVVTCCGGTAQAQRNQGVLRLTLGALQ